VLATYVGSVHAGRAAATTRRLGRGTVTMIGVSTDDGALERALVREAYRRAGIGMEELPSGTFVEWRGGVTIAVNYNPAAVELTLPAGAQLLVGSARVAPGGVVAWRER
jgi:beta-galactosidase